MSQFIPKIKIEGSTSNEPFVKFTQNYLWTSSNFCLYINNGYTNLNGLVINGLDANDTIYTSNTNLNMSFNVTGNNNILFKTNKIERLRILNTGNVGIGTTISDYKLNVNGSLNSTSYFKNDINLDNIYLLIKNNFWLLDNTNLYTDPNSNINNIGIGNTTPLGTLHIGSPNINNNGTLIISKKDNINNRNFKFGYDDNFNFVFGDFGKNEEKIWTKQFYINSLAPEYSFIILSDGNIGIGTNNTDEFKVNINGNLKASGITGNGENLTNLNYNNITTNKPDLNNLNNWVLDGNYMYSKYTSDNLINVAIGTNNPNPYPNINIKLNVNGIINTTASYYINGVDIDTKYLQNSLASLTYLTLTQYNNDIIWEKNTNQYLGGKYINPKDNTKIILGSYLSIFTTELLLDVYGTIKSKYYMGDGNSITNINYNNINKTTIPEYLLKTDAIESYYNKFYMENTYSNSIFTKANLLYANKIDIVDLNTRISAVYDSVDRDAIATIISSLAGSQSLVVYHSNILQLPYDYNRTTQTFGFNTTATSGEIINIGGTLKANTIKSTGDIYENNMLLSNIYISSNNYHSSISNYDKIIDRIKSKFTDEKLYPPLSTSLFNNTNSNIINNISYGNGKYIMQTSTNLIISAIGSNIEYEASPSSNLFNYNNLLDSWIIGNKYTYNSTTPYIYVNYSVNLLLTNTSNILYSKVNEQQYFYGHWVILYYSEKFIASKFEIIVKSFTLVPNYYNAPKKITLLGTNEDVIINNDYINNYNAQQNGTNIWNILVNNYVINNYTLVGENIYTCSISIPNNITSYNYYKLIISEVQGNQILNIQQLRFYGFENKKEWIHSGNNIYSLSNISIGTIDNLSPYKLNVNGYIYSSSNIYTSSNIGIGNTSPFGNLHIASPYNISDGTLIISKKDNINNRNFKFGYDDNFNFVFGDFGKNEEKIWTKQFYINSNASNNSLTINNSGYIGIGTLNNSLTDKLYVNGNTTIIGNTTISGSIKQTDNNTSNIFKSDIYASNNIYISSNLNVSNIFTSNINVSNYINVNGFIYVSNNINIGTSNNSNSSLNIQSGDNSVGIRNASYNLGNTKKISSFIGKNNIIKNGFYNYYYHYSDNNNYNYLSWATSNFITIDDLTPDILCITANKNIGIGITNPTSVFQIGLGGKFKISSIDNDYALIGLNNTDSTANTKIYLNGSTNKIIQYYANGGHIFYSGSSATEQMRINNNGNIGIGTIDSDYYKLNVNGYIYSSSNIYTASNIGIGNIAPLGNLHIASPNYNSDGTLIISKKDNINNRNFKFGYDDNFNFVFGDFGKNEEKIWTKQFYINSNAPQNSLIINTIGNIGISNINPLGNLHIASPYNISDGTLIISKKDNINNRNFKFGYDDNFNFVFGDFGKNEEKIWTKQFYINSNASNNSLTINNSGYIGIGTLNNSLTEQILYVNGNTTINGTLSQLAINGNPNNFQNPVCIFTTSAENYKLNVNGDANIKLLLNTSNLIVNNDMTVLNGNIRVGVASTFTLPTNYSVYIEKNTYIKGNVYFTNGDFSHNVGNFNINSTTVTIANNALFQSYIGIGVSSAGAITNILQIGNGGRLRISNGSTDYTVIGTTEGETSFTNTRIIINGSSKSSGDINNRGNIEYYTANSTGKHIFYKSGTSNIENELMRIDNNGNVGIGTSNYDNFKLNVNGNFNVNNINCVSLISSNSINIGVNTLDKTKQLNVYGSIFASSNANITSNIYTSNIYTSNIINTGSLSNIGDLFINGSINQTGTYNFNGINFNIGIITDNTKSLTVGGNISSSKDIIAHSNLITTTIKSVFSSNTSNLFTCNLIVTGSTILNSNIIQNNSFPITLTGNMTLNTSTSDDQITINNTSSTNYARIKFTNNIPGTYYGYIGIGGTNIANNYKNNLFIQSQNNIILNTAGKSTSDTPSILINNLGYIGISTFNATNILQIGDGGRLRIANDITDYTVIGTTDGETSSTNTRIIINSSSKSSGDINNRGNIEYYTTNTTGKHIFYKNGTSNIANELMRIDNNGNIGIGTSNFDNFKLNVNGQVNVSNLIRENGDYLSNIYVKNENLSNLSINNFNLKKKFGYNIVTKGTYGDIVYNSSNYYKFDIDLRLNTKNLVNTIGNNKVCYRSFNIKCFLSDCSFETFNNGIPNILQYDVYMSSNPINPSCFPPMISPKPGLNICAIGIPENYKLNSILPSYITLLRHDNTTYWFNYLSIVSPCSNLQVSYIIEDYLS